MSIDRLYGTRTSPYVRRARVAALEMGIAWEFCDTASEAGQAELRKIAPLWKVPVAHLGGEYLFDSELILSALSRRDRGSPLGPWPKSAAARNIQIVIDGAIDALINIVYLARDGLAPEQAPYLAKQRGRAEASLRWVDQRVEPMGLAVPNRFSWVELGLVTALEWVLYRDALDLQDYAGLSAARLAHQERPSLVQTRPTES